MTGNDLNNTVKAPQAMDSESAIQALKERIAKEKRFATYVEMMGQFCWSSYIRAGVHGLERELEELEAKSMKATKVA